MGKYIRKSCEYDILRYEPQVHKALINLEENKNESISVHMSTLTYCLQTQGFTCRTMTTMHQRRVQAHEMRYIQESQGRHEDRV